MLVAEEDEGILPNDNGFLEEDIRGVDARLPNEDGLIAVVVIIVVVVVLFIVVGMIKGVVVALGGFSSWSYMMMMTQYIGRYIDRLSRE